MLHHAISFFLFLVFSNNFLVFWRIDRMVTFGIDVIDIGLCGYEILLDIFL